MYDQEMLIGDVQEQNAAGAVPIMQIFCTDRGFSSPGGRWPACDRNCACSSMQYN